MYEKQARIKFWANVAGVAAVLAACFFYLGLDPLRLLVAVPSFAGYIAANFFPPSLTHIQAYLSAVLQTVAFAVVSTCISVVLSLVFALLMSRAVIPYKAVRAAVRAVIGFLRNIPVIIWASLLVFIFGIGSMVGLIALVLATTGFLSRSYAESINEIAKKKLEPLRASGVGTWGMIRHGLLPEFAPTWANWTLFAFELNIRASAVLGMVGAGGMGVIIQTNLTLRRFDEAATLILLLIAAVLCIEFAAGFVRKKIINGARRARFQYRGRVHKAACTSRGRIHFLADKKIRVMPLKTQMLRWLVGMGAVVLFFACLYYLDLDVARFVNRLSNAPRVLRLLAQLNTDMLLPGLRQFFTSFAMGAAGLILGGALAFVLAFLAADNIAPWKPLAVFIKAFVSIIRAVPSLVIILMIVAAIGLGHTTGVVGLALSSMGYLTKAFIASIEEQGRGTITAMRATGANWGQIVVHGLLPAVVTGFLAWVAIRLETSVAESITLGVVGAGGIGTLLAGAIRQFDYPTVSMLILIIFVCMFVLELAANGVRRRFL